MDSFFHLLMLAGILSAVMLQSSLVQAECTKAEYKAKFGALPTYAMHATNDNPAIEVVGEEACLIADVSYRSFCTTGGSMFTATFVHRQETGKIVLFLKRLPALCKPDENVDTLQEWKGTVCVPLDAAELPAFTAQQYALVAFPPDGEYEIYSVKQREATHSGMQARYRSTLFAPAYAALARAEAAEAEAAAEASHEKARAQAPAQGAPASVPTMDQTPEVQRKAEVGININGEEVRS